MTLYEINQEIERAYLDLIDPETGEIVGDTSILDQLTIERDQKLENCALMAKNLRAESEALKAEGQTFMKRAKTAENRAEWFERYLFNNLQGEPFKTVRTAISFRKTHPVNILDMSKIPEEYLRYKDPEPDKTAIKKAINAGKEVPGAELADKLSMTIK